MERELCWEMDEEEIRKFLSNVSRHVFTIRRIEPYDFPRAVPFSLWIVRGFIFKVHLYTITLLLYPCYSITP